MNTPFIFSKAELRPLVEHAASAPSRAVYFAHTINPEYWREGAKQNAHGFVEPEDVDPQKIPPYLLLVKDTGVYLLSGGVPRFADPARVGIDGKPFQKVAYARGLGADADYEVIRGAAGGDDFAEPLPLSWLEEAMNSDGDTIGIVLSENSIEIIF